MDLTRLTTAGVEALLRLPAEQEREELEMVMRESGQSGTGGCTDCLLIEG